MPEPDASDEPDGATVAERPPEEDAQSPDEREQLPEDVVSEVERLTRLARDAVDDAEAEAYREQRADQLDEHDFTARVRDDNTGETLVLHPDEWVEAGTIRPERVEDTDRAVEVSLSGPGDPDEWDAVDEHNRAVVARVRESHGPVHGDNAAAFADFMGNHYARPVESATSEEVAEFLSEYFPRNAWPTEKQRRVVEESIDYVFEVADDS